MQNIIQAKEQIIKLANIISVAQKGAIDSFHALYPLLLEYNFSQDVRNFCNAMRSSEDWISPQDCRKLCSADFIKQMDEEESKLLDYYKEEIKIFVSNVLQETKNLSQ